MSEGSEEKENKLKKFKKSFWVFIVIVIIFILMTPFLYSIIAKVLVNTKIFTDIEELTKYVNTFKEYYWIIALSILIAIIIYFSHNREFVHRILSSIDTIALKNNENEVSLSFNNLKEKKAIFDNIENSKREVNTQLDGLLEDGQQLDIVDNRNESIMEIEEMKEERNKYRIFAADKVTNKCCKRLLQKIFYGDKIEVEIFRDELGKSYNIRKYRKNQRKSPIDKVNEVLIDLRDLNIIEYSEDGEYILLTMDGKEFVKSYLKGVE